MWSLDSETLLATTSDNKVLHLKKDGGGLADGGVVGRCFFVYTLSDKISEDKSAENLACCRKFCPLKFIPNPGKFFENLRFCLIMRL